MTARVSLFPRPAPFPQAGEGTPAAALPPLPLGGEGLGEGAA